MKKVIIVVILFMAFTLLGCNSEDSTVEEWVDDSPFFTHEYGEMFGKKGIIGIIGPKEVTESGQKWMWHFWGSPEISYKEWEVQARQEGDEEFIDPITFKVEILEPRTEEDEIYGHAPSTVLFPSSGLWELNVYIDGQLFDQLIVEIDQK